MKTWKKYGIIALIILVAAAGFGFSSQALGRGPERYIIVFNDDVTDVEAVASELARAHGLQVNAEFNYALQGVAVVLPPGRLRAVENDPRVKYVEPDLFVNMIDSQFTPYGVQRIFAEANPNIGIDGNDDLRVNVDVAIIDTGIDIQHSDLNVYSTINCTAGRVNKPRCEAGGDDDQYHGTHVAGTIGALDNAFGVVGVAPGARLWGVKSLDSTGNGYMSWIIAGVDYVTQHAAEIEVANMSLGCLDCYSQGLYDAITQSVASGVTYVVSAGNDGQDASRAFPGNHPDVITVSAVADYDGIPGSLRPPTCYAGVDDTMASFSNYGAGTEIAAPGVCIYSTFPLERNAYGTLNGTSMAAPHVAGAAALLLSSGNYSPAQVEQLLRDAGNYNWNDTSGDGIQEPLLDVSNAGLFAPATVPGEGVPPDNPAALSINSPLNGASFDSGTLLGFWGEATDFEDGDLSGQIIWTSNLDGQIGTGSSFVYSPSDGVHNIVATVADSGGNTSTDSITITMNGAAPPPNEVPVASINSPASGASFDEGAAISFAGSASDAEDGDLGGQLVWTSDRDGQIGTGASFSAALSAGEHTITASVEDSAGASASDAIALTVVPDTSTPPNEAPAVSISSPLSGAVYEDGQAIAFVGAATDAEDGDLSAQLVWTSDRDGQFGTGASFFATLSGGTHVVTASVADSAGTSDSATISLTVTIPSQGALSVSVSTDKTAYRKGNTVFITVHVEGAGSPVAGAAVSVYIDTPKGAGVYLNGTTNASGDAVILHTVNTGRDGKGTYYIEATATLGGFDPGTGTATFTAN